jgi:hypothetical protein
VETVLLIDTNDSAKAAARLMIGVAKFCKVLMIWVPHWLWWTAQRLIRQLKPVLHGACQFVKIPENWDISPLSMLIAVFSEPQSSRKS